MKAVLRIVLGYFSFLPLQRWISTLGAALLATGLLLTLWAPDAKASIRMAFFIALPGAFLIAVLPLALGGMAMRFASSRSFLHLRPRGRFRMLLASTLTIALLATAMTLPLLVEQRAVMDFGFRLRPSATHASEWFLGCCAFTVAAWLITFALSSSRVLYALLSMLPLFMVMLFTGRTYPPPAMQVIGAAIVAAWAIFAIWYSRVSRIKRPTWVNDRAPLGFNSPALAFLQRFSGDRGDNSRSQASRQYLLGSTSVLANIAVGAFPAVLALVVTMCLPQRSQLIIQSPAFIMSVLALLGTTIGCVIARRARLLWLRAGLDRPALLQLAERSGLPNILLMFGAGAIVLLLGSVPAHPQQLPELVLCAVTYGMLTAGLFYFGLSLTRGWNGEDVLRGIGLFILTVVMNAVIKQNFSTTVLLVATGIFALLTVLLRWHAGRRWRALDWRIAKLPSINKA